jgi:hypothetical protein
MRKIIISSIIFFVSLIYFVNAVFSWDNEVTHKDLSIYAANSSVLSKAKGDFLQKLGFANALDEYFQFGNRRQKVYEWLQEGAFLEDAGSFSDYVFGTARSFNHFHNPTKPWDSAGLDDYFTIPNPIPPFNPPYFTKHTSGESALKWAQDVAKQQTYSKLEGDQTWQTIRNHYYNALTSKTDLKRQGYFARVFKGLGHQMHLIQDMAVPAHVRNDAHPEDSILKRKYVIIGNLYFETWAKKNLPNVEALKTFAPNPLFASVSFNVDVVYNNLTPITQLIDTNIYNENVVPTKSLTWGLSEYTNSNFVSDDTIFTENFSKNDRHYFPYPRYTDQSQCYELITEHLSANKNITYLRKKCVGEPVDHFVTVGPLFKYLPLWDLQRLTLKFDETTHRDYAEKLIPRAVGYSAVLLNYFFRGDINLKYETGSTPGYVIANNSNEIMSGTFWIFYDNRSDERKEIWSKPLTINALAESPKFDFPIRSDAKEPGKYILVFKGRMGNENGAVVGRVTGRFLEITPPAQYVYSIIDGSQNPLQFTNITAKVKNANPNEEIGSGTLQAMVEYKINEDQIDFSYSQSATISIDSLSSSTPQEFTFNFSSNPIPVDVTDLYLQIIFTGKVGSEDNAMVMGVKDISEPTPIDVFNNMDRICINGNWYVAGSPEAIAQVDINHNGIAEEWDVYPHDLKDIYLKISPTSDRNNASPTDKNLYISSIPAGDFYRAYVLSDYRLNHSDYVTTVPIVQDDINNFDHTKAIMEGNWGGFALKDQEEYHSEQEICAQYDLNAPCLIRYSPDYYTFRGEEIWGAGGVILDNAEYPPGSKCSWDDL